MIERLIFNIRIPKNKLPKGSLFLNGVNYLPVEGAVVRQLAGKYLFGIVPVQAHSIAPVGTILNAAVPDNAVEAPVPFAL